MRITVNLQANSMLDEAATDIQNLLEERGFTTESPISGEEFHSEIKRVLSNVINSGVYYGEEVLSIYDNEIV